MYTHTHTYKHTHTHTHKHTHTHTWAQMLLAADRDNALLLLTNNNGTSCLHIAVQKGHGSVVEVGPGGRRERGKTACVSSDGTQHMLHRLSAVRGNTPCNTPCRTPCNTHCNTLQHTLKHAKISHKTTHTHAFCLSLSFSVYIHIIYIYIWICMYTCIQMMHTYVCLSFVQRSEYTHMLIKCVAHVHLNMYI